MNIRVKKVLDDIEVDPDEEYIGSINYLHTEQDVVEMIFEIAAFLPRTTATTYGLSYFVRQFETRLSNNHVFFDDDDDLRNSDIIITVYESRVNHCMYYEYAVEITDPLRHASNYERRVAGYDDHSIFD